MFRRLIDLLAPYKKTVAGFLTPGIVGLAAALLPNSPGGNAVTSGEWRGILSTMLVTAGIVFKVKNQTGHSSSRGQAGAARPGVLAAVACLLAGVFFGAVAAAHARDVPPPPRTHWMETPCAQEDSLNCFWNAEVQGDGNGHSFYAVRRDGITCVYYVERTFASNNDDCR